MQRPIIDLRLAIITLACASWALGACEESSDSGSGGGTGGIEYTLAVTGAPQPPVFQIQLDSEAPQQTGAGCNMTTTGVWTNVGAGSHTVTLSGFPADCTLSGQATQTVQVSGGQTATVRFDLSCPAPDGGVFVRFRNETQETYDVEIGSTSFGTLGPGEDSGCVTLTQGGTLPLVLNGETTVTEFMTVAACPPSDTYFDAFVAFAGTLVAGSEPGDASLCQ